MAVTWGLIFLMFTSGVQNIEFHSEESQGSLPTGVPENISIFSSSPIVSAVTDTGSVYAESEEAEGARHDVKSVVPRSNRPNVGCDGGYLDPPATLPSECDTSSLFIGTFSMIAFSNKSHANISSIKKAKSADGVIEPFSLTPALPEASGLLSCQGRCGDRSPYPCSCAAICIVHGNCCDDLNDKCAGLVASAKSRFQHLQMAKVECSSITSTFMVLSCPDHFSSEVKDLNEKSPLSKHEENDVEGLGCDESTQCRTSSIWKTSTPSTKNRTDPGALVLPDLNDLPVTDPNIDDETRPSTSVLVSLMLNVPVTDITTGIIYRNRSVAQCNGVLDLYIMSWEVQAPVISVFENPENLEVLDQIVSTKIFSYVRPDLPTNVSTGSECISVSSKQCQEEWITDRPELETLCLTGNIVYYQTIYPLKEKFFDNIHCLLCNIGFDTYSSPVSLYTPSERTFKLSVVVSLTNSGKLTLLTSRNDGKLYWDGLVCDLHTAKDGGGQCSTTKCAIGFEKRPDGMCRNLRPVKFAIGGANCTYSRSEQFEKELLSLIMCYLETSENAEFDTENIRFDTLYDTRLGVPLLQIHTEVYYPYAYAFDRDFKIWREITMLVYDANFYCAPLETNVTCMGSSCRLGELEIQSITSMDSTLGRIKEPYKGIGLLDNGSITVCEAKARLDNKEPTTLLCQSEPIYASQFLSFNWTAQMSCYENRVVSEETSRIRRRGASNSTPNPSHLVHPYCVIVLCELGYRYLLNMERAP
ncbi:hypothetical protein RRG08_035784 [Elysia crispata]|uniref:SMB domain-containing protein n=1 Tax=Elysia crispata TaxID=231223 RepID=A0AAE0ZLQ2_9GAST|nr:hypothetical protein RRG08_035784 [Elysia crispata]